MAELKKSDMTRKKILTTGRTLVSENGFGGVGLSQILRESGVPKGSFYYYFPSKEAFGSAMIEDYVADFFASVDGLFEAPGTAQEKLMRFWEAWLSSARSQGIAKQCLVVKLGAEVADLSEVMRKTLDDGVKQFIGRICDLLEQGAKDGSVQSFSDPARTAQLLYAKWIGAAILSKLSRDEIALENALIETKQLLSINTL